MVVLHYTGMATGAAALARLRDPEAKVSAHYLVEEDGRVFALVPEARRAWHAGVSFWRGERDINGVSIGIEMVNPGHEWGYRPFPDAQIATLIALLTDIRERWDVSGRPHPRPFRCRPRPQESIPASSSPGSAWPRRATACGSSRSPRPARPCS